MHGVADASADGSINAKRSVQFRRWANKVLKEYLVKGYAVNDRLRRDQLGELRQLVQVVGRTLQYQDVTATADGQALFDVVVDYTCRIPSQYQCLKGVSSVC